jgi:hypothetical protein
MMGEATHVEPTATSRNVERIRKLADRWEKRGGTAILANEAAVGTGVSLALSLAFLPRSAATSAAIGSTLWWFTLSHFASVFAKRLKPKHLAHLNTVTSSIVVAIGLLIIIGLLRKAFF